MFDHRTMPVLILPDHIDLGEAVARVMARDAMRVVGDAPLVVYVAQPEPSFPALPDFFIEPKKRGPYVGHHGDMPIPTGKRKKFKPSRQRRRN